MEPLESLRARYSYQMSGSKLNDYGAMGSYKVNDLLALSRLA